jgi:hypothetical protein
VSTCLKVIDTRRIANGRSHEEIEGASPSHRQAGLSRPTGRGGDQRERRVVKADKDFDWRRVMSQSDELKTAVDKFLPRLGNLWVTGEFSAEVD